MLKNSALRCKIIECWLKRSGPACASTHTDRNPDLLGEAWRPIDGKRGSYRAKVSSSEDFKIAI